MAWLARLDARAKRWPIPAFGVYLILKWSLVGLGAAALAFNYIEKWGAPAAMWLLLAPLGYGIWRAIDRTRPPEP